jgi:hypothetical protein
MQGKHDGHHLRICAELSQYGSTKGRKGENNEKNRKVKRDHALNGLDNQRCDGRLVLPQDDGLLNSLEGGLLSSLVLGGELRKRVLEFRERNGGPVESGNVDLQRVGSQVSRWRGNREGERGRKREEGRRRRKKEGRKENRTL